MAISFPGGTLGKMGTNGDGRMKVVEGGEEGYEVGKRRRGGDADGRPISPDVRSRP
jgi:hypothetical protein